jgi:hypothetical protein
MIRYLGVPLLLSLVGLPVASSAPAKGVKAEPAGQPAPPPTGGSSKKPSPSDSAQWDESSLAQLPADAKGLAQQFIDAVVDSDPPGLAALAGAGIKKGKKTIKGADILRAGFSKATGIKPLLCGDRSGPCAWGKWVVQAKGPSEFWIYSNNDSGYGTFRCAVFTKKGGTWAWTAVATYDTGEP